MVGKGDLAERSVGALHSLAGRAAVVTGGAEGLGRAIARRLAEAGAAVLIGDRNVAQASATAKEIVADRRGSVSSTYLEVSDRLSVAAAAEKAIEEFGQLDVWVNNAGLYPRSPILEMPYDQWDSVVSVNLTGTMLGCREAVRWMSAQLDGGVIVNIASIAGLRGRGPGVSHYVASKHGIIGLTQQLALEVAEYGIRVLGVAPGRIDTPGVRRAGGASSGGGLEGTPTPLGRVGEPDDVARVVLFCASDMSAFMTGTTVVVDGGVMAV